MRSASASSVLPEDACPFRKPFPPDFDCCSAYQATQFMPFDTHYRPLALAWTCRHLAVGSLPSRPGAHYGRCRLGDADARQLWVERVRPERLRRMRELQRNFGVATLERRMPLWSAKLKLARESTAVAELELESAVEAYLVAADAFLDENERELEELGMPLAACKAYLRAALKAWREAPAADSAFEVPADVLRAFPVEVRLFLGHRGSG